MTSKLLIKDPFVPCVHTLHVHRGADATIQKFYYHVLGPGNAIWHIERTRAGQKQTLLNPDENQSSEPSYESIGGFTQDGSDAFDPVLKNGDHVFVVVEQVNAPVKEIYCEVDVA